MPGAKSTKGSGHESSNIVAQEYPSEPSFEHPTELPPSSSHPTINIVVSEGIPTESEAHGL